MEASEKKIHRVAVVLAGGMGRRMGGRISKQYIELEGKPIIYHTLSKFEESKVVDEIILVAAKHAVSYCQEEIVDKFGFSKVKKIVIGGKTRCDSVYCGLKACENADIVYIHDGVRPFVTEEILERNLECALENGNAITGVPSKDTVKITDDNGAVLKTPIRSNVWIAQTPQSFRYELIRAAHDRARMPGKDGGINTNRLTDDAMVLERFTDLTVHMCLGSYSNIKITVPEDLTIATEFLTMNN